MDRRKEMILFAVVEEYIRSATPVGSKTVVQGGVPASPATVRSEMSALTELGLLEQPHPSAGRVPTDLGFRLYADSILSRNRLDPDDQKKLKDLWAKERRSAEDLIVEAAQALSRLSPVVGMVMVVPAERSPLRSVHFLEHGRNKIRAMIQLAGGRQQEVVVANEWRLDAVALSRLNNLVNRIAPGLTLLELRRELIRQREEARAQADVLLARAVEISGRIAAAEEPELFVYGQANLFDHPEFAEVGRIREVLRALDDKSLLIKVLEGVTLATGIRVLIGSENSVRQMKSCSLISSTYGRGEITAGTLGVMGPTRMDYARLIPLVHYASDLISESLSRGEMTG